MQTERVRIQKIIEGDHQVFKELIEDYQRLVCHVVYRMILNDADREEICQDVFIKVYANLASFEFKSKFSSWIAKISYNTCINYLKKKKLPLYDDLVITEQEGQKIGSQNSASHSYLEKVPGTFPQPDESMMNKEAFYFLHEEINKLPLQYRAIITMYHLDNLSYCEIGDIMNLPEGTVKSYIFRARKLLKERLREKFPVEELW